MGYCFGVRRAMDLAFSLLERSPGPVYSHGPMIHNRQAMEILGRKGLGAWPEDPGALEGLDRSKITVIIRAHGLAPAAEAALRETGVALADATCPRVAEVQRLVAQEAAAGADVIIWGAAGHPEVEGLMGYAAGRGRVLSGPEAVAGLGELGAVTLVAQTTQNLDLWPEVEAAVRARFPAVKAVNTICQATVNRQSEARRLAEECEALVVVGDRHSGNTRRLFEIGRAKGLRTVSVEGPEEIGPELVEGVASVGLVAGASTPHWQSRLVQQRLMALGRASQNSPLAFALRLLRALVLSNIHVGLGSGCLGWALARGMGYELPGHLFGLFFFFTQAMHLMNGYLDLNVARYNDLDRADFLLKYRPFLLALGLGSMLLSLTSAWLAGRPVLGFILMLSVLAYLYAVPWPMSPLGRWGVRRLKDVPLSKSLCTALGWASLLTVPPFLAEPRLLALGARDLELAGWAYAFVFFQVFSRSLRVDFQDSLGDRIFGRRTVVTILGWRLATRVLLASLLIWAGLITAASLRFPGGPLPWLMVSGPLYNAALLPWLVKKGRLSGFAFDALLDSQFLLAALMVELWSLA
jgi:4-hydroxy-3-methylbut-2-enyl diphosphate reductase